MTQPDTSQPDLPTDIKNDDTFHPADVLIRALVALLAPMFLLGADGNIGFAEMAALETLRSYRAQNHASLIKVANVIAFGLATLGSLSLSMQDDLPIPLVLRLRSNANALDRSAARNERAVNGTEPVTAAPPAAETRRGFDEAAVQANVAEAARQAAEFRAGAQAPKPPAKPAPAPAAAPAAHQAAAETGPFRKMWAAAMADVAAEELAEAAHLPPAQRKEMTAKAAILSSTANSLLTGAPLDFASLSRPGEPPSPIVIARR
jgi:hypothetical protein